MLRTPPAGPRPVPDPENAAAECVDDRGAPWLATASGHASDEGRQVVLGR
ncbi:hypothetical protein [Streptomyces thermolilacinus]